MGALLGLIFLLKLVLHIRRDVFNTILMKLSELADLTGSTIVQGSDGLEITSAAGIDTAGPGDVTFLANPKYTKQVGETKASAIFLNLNEPKERDDIAVLRAEDPHVAYTLALRAFFPAPEIKPFVHPTAVIDPSATVHENVEIHANVVIAAGGSIASGVRIMPNVTIYENVSIGENTAIHSGVSVRENCEIGRNCIIHNNSTIGADGFGYARTKDKKWLKVPQTGRVVIADDVEIGANVTIDSPSTGETRVERGVKVDNLVQIGHSSIIDEDALLCAQVGLAGSSDIGKRAILAGQVGVAGHLKVGDDAVLAAQAGIGQDVEAGSFRGGPNLEQSVWVKAVTIFRRLPDIVKLVRELDKRVTQLEASAATDLDSKEDKNG